MFAKPQQFLFTTCVFQPLNQASSAVHFLLQVLIEMVVDTSNSATHFTHLFYATKVRFTYRECYFTQQYVCSPVRFAFIFVSPQLLLDQRARTRGAAGFFLLYAAWVRSRAERPSVSYTKVVMEVAWTGHNLQFTKTN